MATEAVTPQSRQLFEAGFKNFGDPMACLDALIADVIAERVTTHEGNEINAAIHAWVRGQEGVK